MPATKLVCPHCEKQVEIQVSAVTRSRPCPECGEMVMLQMAEKSTKQKRRALLMTQEAAPEPLEPPPSAISQEPQPLPGDAFDRMRMDPEVARFRRRLLTGLSIVAGLVILLLGVGIYQSSQEKALMRKLFGTGDIQLGASLKKAAQEPAAAMLTPDDLPPPATSGNLVFRPSGGKELKSAAPSGSVSNENLARLAAGEEVLRQFLDAGNWRNRALTVRDQLRVAPLMSMYYEKNDDGPVIYDSLVEPQDSPPRFTEHVVVFQGGGRRSATVEHTIAGAKVDWESFVGAGERPWAEFLGTRPSSPLLFRVLVSPAGHYEGMYGDPATLKCYSLRTISEPGAKVVYGYLHRQSPMVKEIDYWLEQNDSEAVPLVLRLKFPPDAPVDFQVWIHEFVKAGWVVK